MQAAGFVPCGGLNNGSKDLYARHGGEGGEKRASSGGKAPRPDEMHIYRRTAYYRAGGPDVVSLAMRARMSGTRQAKWDFGF